MEERELIFGIHSIAEAIQNSDRTIFELVATEQGLKEFRKKTGLSNQLPKVVTVAPHELQERAKRFYRENDDGITVDRVPSQIFLVAEPLMDEHLGVVYDHVKGGKPIKIFCLDHVTDVHNGAAIMRTAAFYGVDYLITSMKGSFGRGPSFSRIASGGLEHVRIVRCSSLPKAIDKLQKLGAVCIGFSEHAKSDASLPEGEQMCLVMGAEDTGLSHAVMRIVENLVSFNAIGAVKSLNVSVAAAVSMEKYFGPV